MRLLDDGTINHVFAQSAEFCADLELQSEAQKSSDLRVQTDGDDKPSIRASAQNNSSTLNVELIGNWIQEEDYSNKELAEKLNISERAVSSLRNNGKSHGREAVTKLANLMKRDVDDLYLS